MMMINSRCLKAYEVFKTMSSSGDPLHYTVNVSVECNLQICGGYDWKCVFKNILSSTGSA